MRLVAKYGVQGATNARIAKAAGISEKMLYLHFGSRKALLLAVLNEVFDRATAITETGVEMSAVEQLRAMGIAKWGSTEDKDDTFINPLYEFLATPPLAGFRDHVLARQQAVLHRLEAIVIRGVQERSIRPEVDSAQLAWELLAIFMSEDLWYLSGFGKTSESTGRSASMLERLLRDISTVTPPD